MYELHFTLHPNPPSTNVLSDRIYTNLKSLSFSSELTDSSSYDTDIILIDLQKICSTSVLANIKRIYLYNQIYPINFRKYEKIFFLSNSIDFYLFFSFEIIKSIA